MRSALWLPMLGLVAGCNWINNVTGLGKDANKAVGASCRQTGRSLEECYLRNPDADKAQVYSGWREMHEYMEKHRLATMEPLPEPAPQGGPPKKPADGRNETSVIKPGAPVTQRSPLTDEAADKAAEADPQVEAVLSAIKPKAAPKLDGEANEQGRMLNLIRELNQGQPGKTPGQANS
ncbi:hypothetical protein [Crenobacter cavernae]|uniref:Uncharacterized protein n=1 Tax=Crenobacter cavernae TaxID=2290923 RepID=A0A345Y9K1_9NEIS|nr:hypothetical protein [Crenobacter cavernae]AXK40603.1 hypothetical protein DWG20_14860 [Crenobacter cavernae]